MGLFTRMFKAISHEISRRDTDAVVSDVPYTDTVGPGIHQPFTKDVPQDNQILTRAETKLFNALTKVINTQLYVINLKTRLKDANLATINVQRICNILKALCIV